MAAGTVKWLNVQKGYGFIRPEGGGKDVFVHISTVQAVGPHGLHEGQRVTFEVARERGKDAAANPCAPDPGRATEADGAEPGGGCRRRFRRA